MSDDRPYTAIKYGWTAIDGNDEAALDAAFGVTPKASPPMNSANYPTLLGPVKCPSCGWDDGGELRIVDWYDEMSVSYQPPASTLAVWGDNPLEHDSHGLAWCEVCDEDFSDPSTMERRET